MKSLAGRHKGWAIVSRNISEHEGQHERRKSRAGAAEKGSG